MTKFFTQKILSNALRKSNGNVCFFSNADLREVLHDCAASERATCMAELFFRWFVGGMCDDHIETDINSLLPNGELNDFRKFLDNRVKCHSQGNVFDRDLFNSTNDFALKCQTAIRSRFKELFDRTDGFIPVYSEIDSTAFFIPFHIEESENTIVVDSDGIEISQWIPPLEYLELEKPVKLVLHCSCQDLSAGSRCADNANEKTAAAEVLKGNSFLLPVYIGIMRHKQKLPRFAVWKLLSTGAFSAQHSLVPVETKEKVTEFKRLFPNSLMLLPESSSSSNPKGKNIHILPLTQIQDLYNRLRDFVERTAANMVNFAYMEYGYATRRVNDIIDKIRHRNQGNWEAQIAQIDALLMPLDELSNTPEYLKYQSAKAEALCHCGNAPAALKLNNEIEAFAIEHNCKQEALHIAIDRLVNLTDELDFKDIFQYADNLEQRLIAFDNADLLMRFYGTMGQGYAYAALYDNKEDFSQKSKVCFYKALENAAKLKGTNDFCKEMAQDKNYWHLWHALFVPGTPEEENAFRKALNYVECNLQHDNESRVKNMAYLMRQRAFALYRCYLKTGQCLDFNPSDFEITSQGEDWVYATTLKYIATLWAAKGYADKAQAMFNQAMNVNLYEHKIFNFIRLTIVLQAAFSLHDDSLLPQAEKIVDSLKDTEYEDNARRWLNCVKHHEQPPALEYWY